jgi:hypothetical protein
MRVYTVHYRPGSVAPDRDAVLVKEGFNWPAFLVAAVVAGAVTGPLGPFADAAGLALAVFLGAEANDWRRAWLARRGYVEQVVAAANRSAALRRFVDLLPAGGW